MRARTRASRIRLVGLAAVLVVGAGCDLSGNTEPVMLDTISAPRIWPIGSVYAGQSAVDPMAALRVRGLHWSIADRLVDGAVHDDPGWVALVRLADMTSHPFSVAISERRAGSVDLLPVGGLDPDTDYVLAFPYCTFMPHVDCPPPLRFSTASAPRVLSLWRAGDTLMVVFSEPMEAETLYLGHGSVDMIFEEEGRSRSVVGDLNVADFAWDTQGAMFLVAPISEVPFRLVLGPAVRSARGQPLDTDADGAPDRPARSFVHSVYPTLLPICHTRNDYPDPCIDEARAATVIETFQAPFDVELDL